MQDKNYYETSVKSKRKDNEMIIGVSMMAFAAFFLVCLIFSFVIGPVGAMIRGFLTGAFGLCIYAVLTGVFLFGFMKFKKRKISLPFHKTLSSIGMLIFALLFIHLVSSAHLLQAGTSFSDYTGDCYRSGLTVGGAVLGALVYPVAALAGKIFTFIFLAFLFAVCALGFTNFSLLKPKIKKQEIIEEPLNDEGFFKDFSRSAKQVQPVGNKTLFVSQIKAKQTSSMGETSKLPVKKVADLNENNPTYSKTEQAHNKLYNFFDYTKESKPAPAEDNRNRDRDNQYKAHAYGKQSGNYNSAYNESIERARSAVNSNLGAKTEQEYTQKPVNYGIQSYGQNNFDRNINENSNNNFTLRQPGPYEDSGEKYRRDNYNTMQNSIMPNKLYSQPNITKDGMPQKIVHSGESQHYSNIIDGEKYAELKKPKESKPVAPQEPAPPVFKAPKIIDGEDYSRKLEEMRKREQESKRNESVQKSEILPDLNKNYASAPKPKMQKFIIGDLESEKLANKKEIEQMRAESMSAMKKQFETKKPQSAASSASATGHPAPPEQNAASKTLRRSDEYTEPVQKPVQTSQRPEEKLSDNVLENKNYIPIDFGRIFAKKDKVEEKEEYEKEIFDESAEETDELSVKERWDEKVEALEKINSEMSQSSFIIQEESQDYKPAVTANFKALNENKNVLKDQVRLDDYMQSAVPAAQKTSAYSPKRKANSKYVPPLIELLDNSSTFTGVADESSRLKAELLEETLKQFNAPAKVIGITKGPAVTRYELQMAPGIPVAKVRSASDDIAYALAAKAGIRIEAPIPGRQAVGVEVPNEKIDIVSLREIIDCKEFNASESALCFALGKDIAGKNIVCDLGKMPHLLIAGATNSGKSSCLNSLITSLIYKTSPEDLRFILIDPKRVEFVNYEGLPHLLLERAITSPQAALNALNWAMEETERRYTAFASLRVRDFKEYAKSEAVTSGEADKIPYIVIVVDELADLMMDSKKEFEDKVRYIAQKSRAAGIHLVLATQRPSVDVITGTIKANLPSRIAFSVTNFQDSKTILDSGGAEKLLGRGDMLYAPIDQAEPYRVQGAYVTSPEVTAVVEYVKKHNESIFDDSVKDIIYAVKPDPNAKAAEIEDDGGEQEYDPIMPKVLKYFIDSGKASISIVQRKFGVGFNRAANIVDYLEMKKFVGASDGTSKQRAVNISTEEFENIFGDIEY